MTISKKTVEELTNEELENLKIEFSPVCFDSFEGTQQQLDELVEEITRMIKSGEFVNGSSTEIEFIELDIEDVEDYLDLDQDITIQ